MASIAVTTSTSELRKVECDLFKEGDKIIKTTAEGGRMYNRASSVLCDVLLQSTEDW